MINPIVSSLNKSATLKITSLTKKLIREGKDVVNFAAGEPDFDTPLSAKQAATNALDQGLTKYTPSTGMPALKEAIAGKLKNENGLPVSPKNIIVTAGAKYAVFVGLLALIEKGDEVIVPSPYWVSYPEMVKLASGKLKVIETAEENNFKISADDIEKAATAATKVLILNYPNNPSGIIYSRRELEDICSVAKSRDIFVLSDEIYEKLTFDDAHHCSFASLPGADKLTLTVNGFSKTYSMTGWRIGYLAGPEDIISEASKVIGHTTSCACSLSQAAACAALEDKKWPSFIKSEFQKRRDILWEGLSRIPKLKPLKPQGTFYLFCNIEATHLSSFDFTAELLKKQLVSCIPSDPFGLPGYLRISFSTSVEQINKGIQRIKHFVDTL